jgi:hypothetical protein
MERSLEARDRFRCIICGCQANGIAAEFFAMLGEPGRVDVLAREAEATAREIGHVTTLVRVLRARSRVALQSGLIDQALDAARQAVALGEGLPKPQPYEQAQSLFALGMAQQAVGQAGLAASSWQDARVLFARLGASWNQRKVEEVIAQTGATA